MVKRITLSVIKVNVGVYISYTSMYYVLINVVEKLLENCWN